MEPAVTFPWGELTLFGIFGLQMGLMTAELGQKGLKQPVCYGTIAVVSAPHSILLATFDGTRQPGNDTISGAHQVIFSAGRPLPHIFSVRQ